MGRASRFDKPICWRAGSRSAHAWILTLALAGLAGQHEAYAATPIRVSDVNHSSQNQQIAAKGKHVYVVWVDNNVGRGDVFFARSSDRATTFPVAERLNLSNSSDNSLNPQVAASGPYVFVTWVESPSGKVLLRYSKNYGRDFNEIAINLSLCVEPSIAQGVQIAASGNTVHVTWLQDAPCYQADRTVRLPKGNYVHYKYVTVRSQTTSRGGFRFTDSPGESPQLAVSGNNVYLTWAYTYKYVDTTIDPPKLVVLYHQIHFAKSINNGQDFVGDFRFPFPHEGGPRIVASGNNVYVDWYESSGAMLATSTDQGANLNDPGFTPTNLSTALGIGSRRKFSASGNTLYLIGLRGSSAGLWFWKGTNGNGGVNFGLQPIIINPSFSTHEGSAIAAAGQNVHVVYNTNSGSTNSPDIEVFYRHSSDSGGSFGAEQNLSNSPGVASSDIQIATYGDNAYVTWREHRSDLGPGIVHIMVARVTEAAAEPTWLEPEPPSQLRLAP